MYVYNMIRVLDGAVNILAIKDKKARRIEKKLHGNFSLVRFGQSKTRIWFKRVLMILFWSMVYHVFSTMPDAANIIGKWIAVTFFCLFWAEFKIGISNNPNRRIVEVNEDLGGSGSSEWFKVPIFLAILIPLFTLFVARPIFATIFTVVLSLGVFIMYKYAYT